MIALVTIIVGLIICFGGVVLIGAPYLPTLSPQVEAALKLAGLKPGQHLIELGCGDGKVVLAAAEQGIKVTAYEINPILALVAWVRTYKYRKNVKIICANFWRASWPPADAVFTFLLDRYMAKLDKKLSKYTYKPVRLVSFAFEVPDKKLEKKQSGVYLYSYR